MTKPVIQETIVVEGRNDARAVKMAVESAIIITSGFGIKRETYEKIEWALSHGGVIILTDPDHVGEIIRKKLAEKYPDVRHAWISRESGFKDGDIGVENAPPEAILEALQKAHCLRKDPEYSYTERDMIQWGLSGVAEASVHRACVGQQLGIGYGNARQFLHRLNIYGIQRPAIEEALKECEGTPWGN